MEKKHFTRRDFNRLTAAALGGVVTGTLAGCGDKTKTGEGTKTSTATGSPEGSTTKKAAGAPDKDTVDVAYMVVEPHVCKGLNTCNGKGKGGENACAGQGACFTANEHTCHGENECKGQGGCDGMWGANACQGKGGCGVPLSEKAWPKARAQFEKAWMDSGKKDPPGAAPK